jgi:aryl-alcohol dehydrogenase-like predicted oxidoreductase
MEQTTLGRSGLVVSRLCLGTMTFGRETDEAASRAMVDRFVDAGGNFVDTADVYGPGTSEQITGRAIAGRREQIVLATKVRFAMGDGPNDAGLSRRHVIAACEASLRRLGTDWIDLYQVHMWDALTPIDETLAALTDLVRQGKVRYIGASNFAGWQLMRAELASALHGLERFVSLQPQYSLIERRLEYEIGPAAQALGLGLVPWAPLAQGLLSGKYDRSGPAADTRMADARPDHVEAWERRDRERNWRIVDVVREVAGETGHSPSQVALNWLLTRPGMAAPIVGARRLEQLDDNLGAVGWRLEPEHVARLDDVSAPEPVHPYDFIAESRRRPLRPTVRPAPTG